MSAPFSGTAKEYGRQPEHQGSHRVWGTILDRTGTYRPLDLE
jgi:hypothetical protein